MTRIARETLTSAEGLAGVCFGLMVVGHLLVHARADLTFPVPWPDELHFALPARALARDGTLATPQLHPARPLMWMPHGYALLTAPIHALTDAPLRLLRGLSLACILIAATALRAWLQRSSTVWLATLAAGAWLLHPAVLASGNVARMDAATLALVLLAFERRSAGHPWLAWSLLALAPLVHPNGLWFAAAALIWEFGRRGDPYAPRWPPATRVDRLWVALVALAWLIYGVHVALHAEAFAEDMRWQFARKASRDLGAALLGPHGWRPWVLAGLYLLPRRLAGLGPHFAFALAAWGLARVGHEMWYEPFDALVALYLVFFAVERARSWLQPPAAAYRWPRRLAAAALVLAILYPLRGDRPRAPDALSWKRMQLNPTGAPYLTEAERAAVAAALRRGGPHRVEFFPYGDAIFFLEGATVDFVDRVRFDFPKLPRVLHRSPDHPPHWQARVDAALEAAEATGHPPRLLFRRDAERAWWWVNP